MSGPSCMPPVGPKPQERRLRSRWFGRRRRCSGSMMPLQGREPSRVTPSRTVLPQPVQPARTIPHLIDRGSCISRHDTETASENHVRGDRPQSPIAARPRLIGRANVEGSS